MVFLIPINNQGKCMHKYLKRNDYSGENLSNCIKE